MSVYSLQNNNFVALAETSGILQNMTGSKVEYVVCANGSTPTANTGIRLSPAQKLKFAQTEGTSYVRIIGNCKGDVIVTPNDANKTVVSDWESDTIYVENEFIVYNGFLYRCKTTHTSGNTFVASNWDLVSWVDWQPSTEYLAGQVVYSGGSLWKCIVSHTSDSTGIVNDMTAGNEKWVRICGYTLPIASASVLGGIKVGGGLTIASDGTLSAISSVLYYKGSKNAYSDLPTSGNGVGDVWNIVTADSTHNIKAGDNVAWNGSDWDNLSGVVDLSGYVQKEIGKGLSTNDYTTAEKNKLSGIATGAEVNVLEGVQVNGTDLTITNKKVNIDLSGKVDKVTGKDLSTNDFTDSYKTKLDGIDTGAEVNVIEEVKVDGTALTVTNKSVNIDLSGKVDVVSGKGLSTNDFTDVYKAIVDGTILIYRQPSTTYAVGDMRYHPTLPVNWYLECTVAGTTDSGLLTITSPAIGDTITDGTVTWKIRKEASTNDISTHNSDSTAHSDIRTLINTYAADNYRKKSTAYALNDIALHSTLPAGWYLECTTAGTTDSGDLTISTPTLGGTVSDGTVVWKITKALAVTGGAMYGSIKKAVNDDQLTFYGSKDFSKGGVLQLMGADFNDGNPFTPGAVLFRVANSDGTQQGYALSRDGSTMTLGYRDLGGSAIIDSSFGANGYIKNAKGFIWEYGRVDTTGWTIVDSNSAYIEVTLPLTITSNAYSVACTKQQYSGESGIVVKEISYVNNSSFIIYASAPCHVRWLAYGI